jgi:molybdate transport system ATP-binding protein
MAKKAFRWLTVKAGTPLIRMVDAEFRSGGSSIFPQTNWEIRAGQCWGLIGDIGSGRNALIHALCGEIPHVSGELEYGFESQYARFDGCPEDGVVHVTFEDMQLEISNRESFAQSRWNNGLDTDEHTVRDFLSREEVQDINPFQVVKPDPPVERRFRALRKEVIELLEIAPLLDRTLDQVSNGERRKIFLAQGLLKDPVMLLLEHPFDGLDRGYRAHLTKVLKRLMNQGVHVLLLMPSEVELPSFVDHIARVKGYRLVDAGPRRKQTVKAKAVSAKRVRLPKMWRERIRKRSHAHPVVEMHKVNVSAGGNHILHDVDWTVNPEECWALSGPNGAGKSTLLSLLQGDNPQTYSNDISLFGKQLGPQQSIWDVKRRMGSVSPEAHLYFPEDLEVIEVVCSGFFDTLRLYDACGKVRTQIAREWLHCLGLADYEHSLFGQLPVEEQRLLLVARAVVKQVDLLILDEPCLGLGATHRTRLLSLVDLIVKATGCALIYVTHRRDEWPGCISHRICLKQGRITHKGQV